MIKDFKDGCCLGLQLIVAWWSVRFLGSVKGIGNVVKPTSIRLRLLLLMRGFYRGLLVGRCV